MTATRAGYGTGTPSDCASIIGRAIAHVAARCSGQPLPGSPRITINFHPDAPFRGRPTIEALAADRIYRSQFETGTSNGGLTAHPGGDRWLWESRIFGGAYDEAAPALRPKYGALNYRNQVTGGSPRFGSSHLRLRPHVLPRATFCYPDSYHAPLAFGVMQRMALIALAEQQPERQPGSVDPLDDYIEAHVHGALSLADDVEALVLDASYRGTHVGSVAASLPCPVEWHAGFRLSRDKLDGCAAYRGQDHAELAASMMTGGVLTPRGIGNALQCGLSDPQSLKRVWHCVARFGSPAPCSPRC